MSNEITIKFKVKRVYHQYLAYTVNDKARLITNLTGKKTLSKEDLNACQRLGLKVEQVTESFI